MVEADAAVPAAAGAGGDAAWDAFVESTAHGSYLQLSGWARVKEPNGWSAMRLRRDGVGAQVLLRRPAGMPWAFAYAPRGPVLADWSVASVEPLTTLLRGLPRSTGRVAHVRIDPEVEADGPDDPSGALRAALEESGWRSAPAIQPATTRVIDLSGGEDALWSDLRKKWRQYVNRARAAGCRVVEADRGRLPEFYAIYRETATRAGFQIRTEASYRAVWDAFAPAGRTSLLFAEGPDGSALATLFLVRCGGRVVEPYGGMTAAGADLRANYLLKWEAIRRSREHGARIYDLWGLAHPGIAHFKTGFGGREVAYIGAWDLVLDPIGRRVYGVAQDLRARSARRARRRSDGGPSATLEPAE